MRYRLDKYRYNGEFCGCQFVKTLKRANEISANFNKLEQIIANSMEYRNVAIIYEITENEAYFSPYRNLFNIK